LEQVNSAFKMTAPGWRCSKTPEAKALGGHRSSPVDAVPFDGRSLVTTAPKGCRRCRRRAFRPVPPEAGAGRFCGRCPCSSYPLRPVGGRGPTTVDVRVIAATNRDLHEAMRERAFHQDLFYRLNVIAIEVPPLPQRREDIPALVQTILTSLAAHGRSRRPIRGVTSAALELLSSRAWPGNVRELANTLERGAALYARDFIDVGDIDHPRDDFAWASLEKAADERWTLAAIEAAYARLVVDRSRGNLSEAARILGVDRRTLQKKLEPDAS
jgi:transcriptional regulator with AAA-type ATPase domain